LKYHNTATEQLVNKEQWLQQQQQHKQQPTSNSSQVPGGGRKRKSAAARATAPVAVEPEQLAMSSSSRQRSEDPLDFLDGLPLYGQQDHLGLTAAVAGQQLGWRMTCELTMRAVYLVLVFAPFLVVGLPMLLVAVYLLGKAAKQQQEKKKQEQEQQGPKVQLSSRQLPGSCSEAISNCTWPAHAACNSRSRGWRGRLHGWLQQGLACLVWLMEQVLVLLERVLAVVDLLLVLLLGGHWAAGLNVWESAGLFLRRRAWRLLLQSCRWSGAAFIKWAQWSSSRRDIFPEDFCDTLSQLQDRWVVGGRGLMQHDALRSAAAVVGLLPGQQALSRCCRGRCGDS
jgi:hypothetical protein